MTAMSPDEFYCGFVLEDYDDWKDTPESIRRGFHLAVSAFHLADHYFQYHARHNPAFAQKYNKLEKFQAALTQRSPAFKTIQDMAIAYKHLYPRATCSIASGGSIESVSYDGQEIEQHWQKGDGQFIAEIIIRHRDGTNTNFSVAIDSVMTMWNEIIQQNDPAAI